MKKNTSSNSYKEWELRGDFATQGIKKMAKRTFQELSSNIEELIVNSYDADATLVQVILNYDKNTLSIIDNGNGMNEDDLSSYVIYGESKKSVTYSSPKFKRTPIGEYGIGGKLAITNICNLCKIKTIKDAKEHVFNMDRQELDKAKYVSDIKSKVITKKYRGRSTGTELYMKKLFSKNIDSNRLLDRFSTRMPISQNFKIILKIIKNSDVNEVKVREPSFEYDQKFEFKKNLDNIGKVSMTIFFTKNPIPATKQGIWTRVNGRIVNEKAEWFDLFKATSGNRYRYRLYGYGEADGLKDFITFSKNDFIDSSEYREYFKFGKSSIYEVQNLLLRQDEDFKKKQDRIIVKNIEKEVNDIVSKLDNPLALGNLQSKIEKEFTKEKENAPTNPYPDFESLNKDAKKVGSIIKRGKDKRDRRNQNISNAEKMTYSGKNYTIDTVDLSGTGDLIKFTKDKNLIEINEKHQLYIKSSKTGSLDELIRILAFTEIANDYSEGNLIIFDNVFNELAKLSAKV